MNFVNLFCMIFWVQNVLIPPGQNFSLPLDQNVLLHLVSKRYNGNIQTFWHRNVYIKSWYSSKSLWIFLYDILGAKHPDNPPPSSPNHMLLIPNSWTWNKTKKHDLLITILKLDSHPPQKIFISFNDSPLKMMKNPFYFILNALFVRKIFKFFILTFWLYRKNGLIRKIKLISKFMTSQSV